MISRHIEYCPRCADQVQATSPALPSDSRIPEEKITLASGAVLTVMLGASGLGEVVYQLEVGPGQLVPLNEPFRAEELLVVRGGASKNGASYVPGDFLTLTEMPDARLVSDPEAGCVCIIAATDPSGLAPGGLAGV